LQAAGAWKPTDTQAAATVAVAAASISALTIRGSIERFGSDIRWRRGSRLTVSIVIAVASAAATTGLALAAGHVVHFGKGARWILVATAAITAFASSILNTYTDQRILRNRADQMHLDSATGRLFAKASTSTQLENPHHLEVVLFVKAPNVLRRDRLRLVQTVCTGAPRRHARILHGPLDDPIWQCYTENKQVSTGDLEQEWIDLPRYVQVVDKRGRILRSEAGLWSFFRSKQPQSVWAEPLHTRRGMLSSE
jgi:hypothetical protein